MYHRRPRMESRLTTPYRIPAYKTIRKYSPSVKCTKHAITTPPPTKSPDGNNTYPHSRIHNSHNKIMHKHQLKAKTSKNFDLLRQPDGATAPSLHLLKVPNRVHHHHFLTIDASVAPITVYPLPTSLSAKLTSFIKTLALTHQSVWLFCTTNKPRHL